MDHLLAARTLALSRICLQILPLWASVLSSRNICIKVLDMAIALDLPLGRHLTFASTALRHISAFILLRRFTRMLLFALLASSQPLYFLGLRLNHCLPELLALLKLGLKASPTHVGFEECFLELVFDFTLKHTILMDSYIVLNHFTDIGFAFE